MDTSHLDIQSGSNRYANAEAIDKVDIPRRAKDREPEHFARGAEFSIVGSSGRP